MLYHLQENRKHLKGLFSCESGEIFMGYFKTYLREMFLPRVDVLQYHAPADYVLNHAVCSFSETVKWWIVDHGQYSPEQVAGFFMECAK